MNSTTHILTLLKQCTSTTTVKQIHAHMLVTTPSIQQTHHNHLLSKALVLKDLTYATSLFSHGPQPNDYSYNVMIRAMATTWKDYPLALGFYLRMVRSGITPNKFTYPFVLITFANLQLLSCGQTTHSSVYKSGFHLDSHVQHCLITMYARCGRLWSARMVFDEITEKDLVSWNSMISCYSKMGSAKEAVELFGRMRSVGFEADERTLVSVMVACGDLGDLEFGRSLEGIVEVNGFKMTSFVGSALIDMYGKCGDLDSAKRVFEAMPKNDRVAWNAMITGYSQNGRSDEAIALFQAMCRTETEPDKITMVSVLSAAASIGALDVGKSVDKWASQKGLLGDVYVGTALIDMFAKCGNLDRAAQIFHGISWKNEVTWNAMISAFAFHGKAQEALSVFNEMMYTEEKVRPNELTFVAVLSACVHAGWVDEGRRWFHYMETVIKISPQIEHYSCMVDLLARAGHVEEAWAFIERMPCRADAIMLGSLLSACRSCKNVEVGERVIQHLLDMEPLNSGNYVISSKLYAGSKRWGASAKMRGLMRDRGVNKTPGCSWIEVFNQLHEFRSGDELHLASVEIHQMIDMLNEELKIEGYRPNIDLV